jgi:4-hydroxythreonine-4-phosphate dehydrogenase
VTSIKRIALTLGEPAGIGVELCLQLSQQPLPYQLVIIGSAELLTARAQQLGYKLSLTAFLPSAPRQYHMAGQLTALPIALAAPVVCGQLNAANSHYVLQTIRTAVQGCLDNTFDAVVTAPVHKAIINEAGIAFTGHTEFIAEITGGYPVMLLATPGLRVALVTIHLPLAQVPSAITQNRLYSVITVLHNDLQGRFGINNPKILVCGLNPHAGEGGHLGREEIEVISPVLQHFMAQGMDIQGPLPADTLFTPQYLDSADAVLAMYHDQGLPVLKHKGFGQAANITLGLPIIRTSVDHGTALNLAGTGKADAGSLRYALETAFTLSHT